MNIWHKLPGEGGDKMVHLAAGMDVLPHLGHGPTQLTSPLISGGRVRDNEATDSDKSTRERQNLEETEIGQNKKVNIEIKVMKIKNTAQRNCNTFQNNRFFHQRLQAVLAAKQPRIIILPSPCFTAGRRFFCRNGGRFWLVPNGSWPCDLYQAVHGQQCSFQRSVSFSLQSCHVHHWLFSVLLMVNSWTLTNLIEAFSCLEVSFSPFETLWTTSWSDLCWWTTPGEGNNGLERSLSVRIYLWIAKVQTLHRWFCNVSFSPISIHSSFPKALRDPLCLCHDTLSTKWQMLSRSDFDFS